MSSSRRLRNFKEDDNLGNECILCCTSCRQLFKSFSGLPSPNALKYFGHGQDDMDRIDPVLLANSLCRLLGLPVKSFKSRFLQDSTSFCVTCTTIVGQVHELLIQLERIQHDLGNFKSDIEDKLKSSKTSPTRNRDLRSDIVHGLNSTELKVPLEIMISECDDDNDKIQSETTTDAYPKPATIPHENFVRSDGDGSFIVSAGLINDNHFNEEIEVGDGVTVTNELSDISDPLYRMYDRDPSQLQPNKNTVNRQRRTKRKIPVVSRTRTRRTTLPQLNSHEDSTVNDSVLQDSNQVHEKPIIRDNQTKNFEHHRTCMDYQDKPVKEYLKCTFNKCRVKFDKSLPHVELRLDAHVKTKHEGVKCAYRCPHCPRVFNYRRLQLTHSLTHTGETPHMCDICGRGFRDSRVLHFHMKIHTGDRQFPCPECPHKSISKQSQRTHMLTHTRDKAYMCELCSSSFVRNYELKDHQRKFHSTQLALTPYQCKYCDKILSGKVGLKWHEQSHTGDLNFKCSVVGCPFRSTTQCRINLHEKSHTTERTFKCDQCEKSYKHKQHLIVHLRVHTGEKPYKCKTCDKEFRASSHLTSHEKLHSGKLAYKCPHCEEAFVLRKYLNRHIEKHQKGKILPHISQESSTKTNSSTRVALPATALSSTNHDHTIHIHHPSTKSKSISKSNSDLSNDASEFIRLMQDTLSS